MGYEQQEPQSEERGQVLFMLLPSLTILVGLIFYVRSVAMSRLLAASPSWTRCRRRRTVS